MSELARQGEVWRIETAGGRSIPVVIVDSAPFVARRTLIVAAQVREVHELPERLLLLAVPLDQPVKGVISVADLAAYRRERFAEFLGEIGSDTLSAVKNALAARFNLDG